MQSRLQRQRRREDLTSRSHDLLEGPEPNEKAPEGPPPSSYANVLATAALFVALGGSSYAAVEITGKDVRDGSLTGADIGNNSLTSADIKNESLLAADFKPGQLRGASGAAAAATWTYHHDVGDGSLVSDLPAIPELAQLTITCDLAHDGTGRLYIHNTSDTTIDFVANVDTTGGAIPHRLETSARSIWRQGRTYSSHRASASSLSGPSLSVPRPRARVATVTAKKPTSGRPGQVRPHSL